MQGYYKAALSGAVRVGGSLIPGDADYVNREAELGASAKEMVRLYLSKKCLFLLISPQHRLKETGGNENESSIFLRAARAVRLPYHGRQRRNLSTAMTGQSRR